MKAGDTGKGRPSAPLQAGVSLRRTLAIRLAIAGRRQEISQHINFHGRMAIALIVGVTIFRKGNMGVVVSLRSRNGEALKIAEQLQGGGHANACGATLPRSVKNIPDAVTYLRQLLNPPPARRDIPLNNLETLFSGLDLSQNPRPRAAD